MVKQEIAFESLGAVYDGAAGPPVPWGGVKGGGRTDEICGMAGGSSILAATCGEGHLPSLPKFA